MNRFDQITTAITGSELFSQSFEYDGAGNIKNSNGRIYDYDSRNQLVDAAVPEKYLEKEPTDGTRGRVTDDFLGDNFLDWSIDPAASITLDYASTSIGINFTPAARIKKVELLPDGEHTSHRLVNESIDFYKTAGTGEDNFILIPKNSYDFYKDEATGRTIILFHEVQVTSLLKLHVLFDDRNEAFEAVDAGEFLNSLKDILLVYQENDTISEHFVYDQNGKRTLKEFTVVRTFTDLSFYYYNTEWILTDGRWAYKYDAVGNLTEKGTRITVDGIDCAVSNDAALSLLQQISETVDGSFEFVTTGEKTEYRHYTYDLLNRLVKVEHNGNTAATYRL